MHFLSRFLVPLGALLVPSSLASPTSLPLVHERQAPSGAIPPSRDPWYTAPRGFESYAPGAILRIRSDPSNITAVVSDCSAAYNILYRSTDAHYRPSWAVTTLLVPRQPVGGDGAAYRTNNNATGPRTALVSVQPAYNTPWIDGSPSYTLSRTPPSSDTGIPATTDDVSAFLGRGWYVNVPDFEGPYAAMLAGPREGHAVLDSIRAVLSAEPFPGDATTRYALWGYSGGSVASEFAAELQASYAPELGFAGVAVGGMVPNVTEALGDVNGSPYAGLVPLILLGVTAEYPAARDFLVGQLRTEGPHNATGFLAALHMLVDDAFVAYAGQDVGAYFVRGLAAVVGDSALASVLGNNAYMGHHGIPQMPVFAYKAIQDEFSDVGESDRLVAGYCALGANILYQRNTVGAHIDEIVNGAPRAYQFLDAVLGGTYEQEYNTTGCTWEDVTVNVTAAAA